MQPLRNTDNIKYGAILLTVAILYSIFSYFTPLQMDDYMFIDVYNRYNGGSDDFSFSALSKFFSEVRANDNSRFANLCSPLTTLVTPWRQIFPFLTGPMIAAMIWLTVRLSGPWRPRRWCVATAVWALTVLLLPWRNSIFVPDYQLNYIYSAVITLAFIWLAIPGRARLRNPWLLCAGVILAAVAGCWHEGFSATTCCALAVFGISRRLRLPRQWWMICLVYGAGTLWITFSPGVLTRTAVETSRHVSLSTIRLLADQSAFVLLGLSMLLFLTLRPGRKALADAFKGEIFPAMFTIALTGTILSMVVTHTPRTSFWPALCSIIAMLILWHKVIGKLLERKTTAIVTATVLYTLCVAQSIYAIVWQYRLYEDGKQIWSLIRNTDSNTIYYDILMPERVSPLTLYFPTRTLWISGFHFHSLSLAIGRPGTIVVPTGLRNPLVEYDTIPGGNPQMPVFRSGNGLWMRPLPGLDRTINGLFDITLRDGTELPQCEALLSDFVTETGDTLTYVKIHKVSPADVASATILSYSRLSENQ